MMKKSILLTQHEISVLDIILRKRLFQIQLELDDPIESDLFLDDIRRERADILNILSTVPEFQDRTRKYQHITDILHADSEIFDGDPEYRLDLGDQTGC